MKNSIVTKKMFSIDRETMDRDEWSIYLMADGWTRCLYEAKIFKSLKSAKSTAAHLPGSIAVTYEKAIR